MIVDTFRFIATKLFYTICLFLFFFFSTSLLLLLLAFLWNQGGFPLFFIQFSLHLTTFFFLATLGLHCCTRAFSSCASRSYSSLWCAGFSLWWLLLLWSTRSRRTGFSSCSTWASVVVAGGLSSCGLRAAHGL